jgi:hypothetical protein
MEIIVEAFRFHIERNEAGLYFAIRNINPPFAFCAKSAEEAARLAEDKLGGRRNVIAKEEWEALLAEDKRLKDQIARYQLPTQRGACNRTKARLATVTAKIRAVDAVIGIDV